MVRTATGVLGSGPAEAGRKAYSRWPSEFQLCSVLPSWKRDWVSIAPRSQNPLPMCVGYLAI